MNNHDLKNLNFILSRSQDQLHVWFRSVQQSMDQAEIDYAVKLMEHAKCQIELELLSTTDEDAQQDLDLAREYLRQFQL